MEKIILAVLFVSLFIFTPVVQAQAMDNQPVSTEKSMETTKDELLGKEVWDKLQNKLVACQDIKDDDFDVLGDFFMGSMMGVNHTLMNQLMVQRLGDDGEKQMHITIGKRLSGCDRKATYPPGANYFMPMMSGRAVLGSFSNTQVKKTGSSMMGYLPSLPLQIVGIITWIALIIFLSLGSIYYWREIKKRK